MRTAPPAIDDANFHLLFPLLSFLRGRRAARRPLTLFIIYLSRPRGPFSARVLVLASPPPSFRHFPFVRDLKESSTRRANKRANNVALNLRQLVSTSSLVCLTIHAPRPPFLPGQPTSQSAVISHSSEPLNPNPEGSQPIRRHDYAAGTRSRASTTNRTRKCLTIVGFHTASSMGDFILEFRTLIIYRDSLKGGPGFAKMR